ncbi:hypothetical protein GCM10025876_34510 [Demequina litorisediminis]|uniref:Uncharacterized protein n=1 Tax=Demequina litorisediminis TaxID=1849022 RepID=A0ABQ6IJB8_9MICO|nr:hypothetical protein [Demequina litorisediminis]GMA37247.1 hypothetical protein GCM10025876_34510 [Demequina litorisediminis]
MASPVGGDHRCEAVACALDMRDRTIDHGDAARCQGESRIGIEESRLGGEYGHGVAPLAHHAREVPMHRRRDQDAEALVAHLPAVAVRAMQDGSAPALGEARDVGQDIGDARGKDDRAGLDGARVRGSHESGALVGDRGDRARAELDPVAREFFAASGVEPRTAGCRRVPGCRERARRTDCEGCRRR